MRSKSMTRKLPPKKRSSIFVRSRTYISHSTKSRSTIAAGRNTKKMNDENDNDSIQLSKRGYMLMPNKILEALVTRDFSKRQLKILLLILRMSLGCQRFAMKYENRHFKLCGL